MVKVKQQDGGRLIDNKVLLGATVPHNKYINLWLEMWEDMQNDVTRPYQLVDYPGEYDINGISVICLVNKNNILNYIVRFNNTKIGIIQSPEILDDDEIGNMDVRLYTDEKIETKINQLELEGEKIRLTIE